MLLLTPKLVLCAEDLLSKTQRVAGEISLVQAILLGFLPSLALGNTTTYEAD